MLTGRGYTPFPNVLLEALMSAELRSAEFKIILVIIRKTFGYHKECEVISLNDLCNCTGRSLSVISKALKKLIDKKIVLEVAKPEFLSGRTLAINEEVDEWDFKKERLSAEERERLSVKERERVVKNDKSTLLKENNKYNYKNNKSQPKKYEEPPSYDKELFERMINGSD